ncbi:MAG: DSD1 family PLP-dependent enzyme [Pseudomonadota bacterium]
MTFVADWITDVDTPYLLLDERTLKRNIEHLKQRVESLGSRLRPHLKTLRTLQAAEYALDSKEAPATVSTLAEARAYAEAGYKNVFYAVGIAPAKLKAVAELRQQGVDLHILVDHQQQVQAVLNSAEQYAQSFSVFIEIDCDGHRGGINAEDPELVNLARLLGPHFSGVMTHAGGSYECTTPAALRAFAQQENNAVRAARQQLKQAGVDCPITSVGSTPTAHFADNLDGIDEVRAGVYMTFDLVMKNIGVCDFDDIAMSVVTTVIGHNTDKNWLLTDSGWMALSRDRGTASQSQDFAYGQVCSLDGQVLNGLLINRVSQEHGVIELPESVSLADFPIGTRLRIQPNHACATAAMHGLYHVLMADGTHSRWHRIQGW